MIDGSADPIPAPRLQRHKRLLIVLCLLGPLLLAEVGVRALIATDRLPVAAAHFDRLEISWSNLAHAGRQPDVLILGDSMGQQDLDPETLAQLAQPYARDTIRIYDLSVSGAGFGTIRILVDQLVREGRLPPVVIIGVSPSILRGGPLGEVSDFRRSPMGQQFSQCADVEGYVQAVDCQFSRISKLWLWRGQPVRLARAVIRGRPRTSKHAGLMRPDGFIEGPSRPIATIQGQVPDALARQGSAFSMEESTLPEFVDLIGALQRGGADVVAVTIPFSPVYIDALLAANPDWEADRASVVTQLAAAAGVPIVESGRFGSWWGDGSSSDVKHLSHEGAIAFDQQLWGLPAFHDELVAALGDAGRISP
jgi:hypothetical protein